jgi:hypothetical protein
MGTPGSRIPFSLSASINRRLGAYVAASAAAGVSLLALTPSADAEIVYTPVTATIGHNDSYNLDLNNDGIVDYIIAERGGEENANGVLNILSARAAVSNQVNCPSTFCISSFVYAAALQKGSQVGGVVRRGWLDGAVEMALQDTFRSGGTYHVDGWANVKNRYLGLKFKIDGVYHYGWARLTVEFQKQEDGKPRTWLAHLSGYAYETTPGKPITAGKTQGGVAEDADESLPVSVADQTSLASLALGANGLAIWRREAA